MYSTARWLVGLVVAVALQGVAWAASPEAVQGQHGMVASRSALASAGRRRHHAQRRQRDRCCGRNRIRAGGDVSGRRQSRRRRIHGDSSRRRPRRDERPSRTRADGAQRDMYLDASGNVVPGRSTRRISLPACPAASTACSTCSSYGTMSRKTVMAPAIRLGERWVRVERRSCEQFGEAATNSPSTPAARECS